MAACGLPGAGSPALGPWSPSGTPMGSPPGTRPRSIPARAQTSDKTSGQTSGQTSPRHRAGFGQTSGAGPPRAAPRRPRAVAARGRSPGASGRPSERRPVVRAVHSGPGRAGAASTPAPPCCARRPFSGARLPGRPSMFPRRHAAHTGRPGRCAATETRPPALQPRSAGAGTALCQSAHPPRKMPPHLRTRFFGRKNLAHHSLARMLPWKPETNHSGPRTMVRTQRDHQAPACIRWYLEHPGRPTIAVEQAL